MTVTLKRLLCVLVVITMAFSMIACSDKNAETQPAEDETVTSAPEGTEEQEEEEVVEDTGYEYVKPDKDVTIEVFSTVHNSSGIQVDPLAQYMQNEFGLIVDWLPAAGDAAQQKLSAMMSAGELPDIVTFHSNNLSAAADSVKAGLLMDLEPKLDMLPNIQKYGKKSMEYYADSLGEGKKYFVGQGISNSILQGNTNWSLSLRWDLYKELGLPEIKTMNDLIPVLKQMQELEPETAEGKKVYGMSFWPDWDGTTPFMPKEYMSMYGVEIRPGYTEYYAETGETKNVLADDSMYHEALKFFYDLNQAGLLDPDSLSQRFDNAKSKYESGRALMAFHSWVSGGFNSAEGNEEAGRGFVSIFPKDAKIMIDQSSATGVYPTGISASTKKEEYALKFLDFYFSTEYSSIISNGIEGEHWNMVDGRPELTELGWELQKNGEHSKTYVFYSHPGLDVTYYDESKGAPINNAYWESTREVPPTNPITIDYYETLGITQPIDLLDKDKNYVIRQAYGLVPPLDDDTNAIISKISPIVKELSWKMVFAADETEFDALWKDMQTMAIDIGLQKVLDAGDAAIEILNENQEKYGDKTIVNYNK